MYDGEWCTILFRSVVHLHFISLVIIRDISISISKLTLIILFDNIIII